MVLDFSPRNPNRSASLPAVSSSPPASVARLRTSSTASQHGAVAGDLGRALREVRELHGLAPLHLAARRLELAGQQAQQRRFAGAVGADQRDAIAGAQGAR